MFASNWWKFLFIRNANDVWHSPSSIPAVESETHDDNLILLISDLFHGICRQMNVLEAEWCCSVMLIANYRKSNFSLHTKRNIVRFTQNQADNLLGKFFNLFFLRPSENVIGRSFVLDNEFSHLNGMEWFDEKQTKKKKHTHLTQ